MLAPIARMVRPRMFWIMNGQSVGESSTLVGEVQVLIKNWG